MGSDDGNKSRHLSTTQRCSVLIRRLLLTVPIALFAITIILSNLPPPEIFLGETFEPNLTALPPQCQSLAQRFYHCQQVADETAVFACHRKWCTTRGHCAPCAGIGDRTRFLLSHIQQLYNNDTQKCIRIQLDYPSTAVAILKSAVYQDPAGWWGELGHYRSYAGNERQRRQYVTKHNMWVQHFFTPLRHSVPWDPCFYHILFRPTRSLQHDLELYEKTLPPIGIHYRTGDGVSFGLTHTDHPDHRVRNVTQGWKRLRACAEQVARDHDFGNESSLFFLATDHAGLKEHIIDAHDTRVVVTQVRPSSYLVDTDEYNAMLELYLLASRKALVVNTRPVQNYTGRAGYVSYFAKLAQQIGFVPTLKECRLDVVGVRNYR